MYTRIVASVCYGFYVKIQNILDTVHAYTVQGILNRSLFFTLARLLAFGHGLKVEKLVI